MSTGVTSQLDLDLTLIQGILSDDREAFARFMDRHAKWVRSVVFGVLGDQERVDDVCQKVWLSVWQRASSLEQPQHWRSWLYRMARHAALDAGREVTRRKRLKQQFTEVVRFAKKQVGALNPGNELKDTVGRAIQGLPALYREPFVLRHLEGWSYKQISDVLGIPVDTVETRLVRARRHLREALQDKL